MRVFIVSSFLIWALLGVVSAQPPAVHVQLVTDEAEAVLAILAKKKANEAISEADWQQLFATEGYVGLKQLSPGPVVHVANRSSCLA